MNGIENFVGAYLTIYATERGEWNIHGRITDQRMAHDSDDMEFSIDSDNSCRWHRITVVDGELTGCTIE